MSRYNHYAYCEDIARRLKPIKHTDKKPKFFTAAGQEDLPDLEARMSEISGILFIAINGTESTFDWKNSDNLMEQPSYLFAIIEQTEVGDSRTIHPAQQHCKLLAMAVISQMMQDYHNQKNGMDLLDPSSFEMKGFGPVKENFYGVLVGFSFNQGTNYEIDPTLWD